MLLMRSRSLKRWRKHLRITQKQAARALRVNLRTLQGWEGGRPMHPLTGLEIRRRMEKALAANGKHA